MFESRHSDYLKEAEKSHFQGQYLEGAIFLWDSCRIFVQPSFDFFLQQNFVCDIMEKKQNTKFQGNAL